jgi:prevent-host-death family protein
MKTASVAALKAHLNDYLEQSQQGPVIVTRGGKPVAALVALTDGDELERLMLSQSPKFRAIVEKSRRQIEETGGIPHEQFWREVESDSVPPPSVTEGSKRKLKSKTR